MGGGGCEKKNWGGGGCEKKCGGDFFFLGGGGASKIPVFLYIANISQICL